MVYEIETMEKDNGKGDSAKQTEFLERVCAYQNRATRITETIATLRIMGNKVETTAFNYGVGFWNCVHENFWQSMIIDLASFFDTDRKTDSFVNFLEWIRNNYKVIYTKKFYERKKGSNDEWKEVKMRKPLEVCNELNNYVSKIMSVDGYRMNGSEFGENDTNDYKLHGLSWCNHLVKFWRDKIYAHKERNINDEDHIVISLDDVTDLIREVETMLCKITSPFNRVFSSFTPMGVGSVSQVLSILENYKIAKL